MTRRNRRISLYDLLLRLLPRGRREELGDQMFAVFNDLRADARGERGRVGVLALWLRELTGLVRFSTRDRLTGRGGSWNIAADLRWAWRGVRSRGVRALVIIGLLSTAIAANGVVFSVVDSLLFNKAPYPAGDRIVQIATQKPGRSIEPFITASLLDQWRLQTDLFRAVDAYTSSSMFITINGLAEFSLVTYITPGVMTALGVTPRWGRTFAASDPFERAEMPVLISEALARKGFGDPNHAVGKTLDTPEQRVRVIGVMPASFAFPQFGGYALGIWAPLDPSRPPVRSGNMTSLARLQPGWSLESATRAMQSRSTQIAEAAGAPAGYVPFATPLHVTWTAATIRTLLLMLLGAAASLLFAACANVASLELAAANQRARRHAVHLALGASPSSLTRVAILEGALLIGAATLMGLIGALEVLKVIGTSLVLGTMTANPIDLDGRAVTYVVTIATLTWLAVSLPIALFASRANVTALLRSSDRSSAASRSTGRLRRGLTTVQVTFAVLLVIAGLLYVRSYRGLVSVDKGFDSTNLVALWFTIPPQYYGNPGDASVFAEAVVRRVRAVPGVLDALDMAPPPEGEHTSRVAIESEAGSSAMSAWQTAVRPGYFDVLRLPMRQGHALPPNAPETAAVVSDTFARSVWPGANAIGRTFRVPDTGKTFEVIGVVNDVRYSLRPGVAGAPSDPRYYVRFTPSMAKGPTKGTPQSVTVTVRLDSTSRAQSVLTAARAIDARVPGGLDVVDDTYAAAVGDVRLATRVVGVFGILTFVIAVAGVYGVMTFLVSSRRREIGIRMALGATRRDIARLVVGSSMRMVVAGAAIGVIGALAASRSIASQLYGVQAVDPLTYTIVTATILATTLLATYRPAYDAASVDPAITLRTE